MFAESILLLGAAVALVWGTVSLVFWLTSTTYTPEDGE